MDYKNPSYLKRTAIHEAGHALVASLQSRLPEVRHLHLSPSRGGHCQLEATGAALAATEGNYSARQELLEQGMRVSAAGRTAEWLAFGEIAPPRRDEVVKGTDEWNLAQLAMQIRKLMIADFHAAARMQAEGASRRLAAQRRSRRSITVTILPVRLDAKSQADIDRHAVECVSRAYDVAEFWLRSKWGAVERVADHLLACGTMPGELVRTLIDTAPEKTKSLPTVEQDLDLMKRAAVADRAIGQTILRVLEAA